MATETASGIVSLIAAVRALEGVELPPKHCVALRVVKQAEADFLVLQSVPRDVAKWHRSKIERGEAGHAVMTQRLEEVLTVTQAREG